MPEFTIKDLAILSGIKAHTLRIWEQRYQFLKPRRTTTNIRYYSSDELIAVLDIALLNRAGFKISNIDRMEPGEIRKKVLEIEQPGAICERQINNLIHYMMDLEIGNFEEVLSAYISKNGLDATVENLIFPFLVRTAIFWRTGHVGDPQEQLITNIIRQKLIVAIETTVGGPPGSQSALLFLPEGEQHELGLLYIYYQLKKKGYRMIYLGPNVPIQDVEFIVKLKKPELAFIHLTGTGIHFEKFLSKIRQRLGGVRTIISGQSAEDFRKRPPACLELVKSVPGFIHCLSSL